MRESQIPLRHAVDEGLMKCALQQFQHTHPQLTSRITEPPNSQSQPNLDPNSERSFVAMELPKFPLDSEFAVKDMLHERFSASEGPLWRVQLITEATMDRAGLGEKNTLIRSRAGGPTFLSDVLSILLHANN